MPRFGAGDGTQYRNTIYVFDNSVNFIAQDIDAKSPTITSASQTLITCTSKIQSINETNTHSILTQLLAQKLQLTLPDNKFDVLFIINSFHDFDKQDEMLDDIYKS